MRKCFSLASALAIVVAASCIPDVIADRYLVDSMGGAGGSEGGTMGMGGEGGEGGTCGSDVELCGTPGDDNCNGLVNDDEAANEAQCVCSPVDFPNACFKLVATQQFGDADDQDLHDVIADEAGDVIVAGYFRSDMYFGTTTLSERNGVKELFVAKLSGDNLVEMWAQQHGGAYTGAGTPGSFDGENRIDVSGDRIAIGGSFEDFASFNGTDNYDGSGGDGYVLLLDADGNRVWSDAWVIEGGDTDIVRDVAFVSNGLIVVGYYEDDSTGPGCPTAIPFANDNGDDIFVAKLDLVSGIPIWCEAWQSTNPLPGDGTLDGDGADDQAHAALLHQGRLFIAGGFSGEMDFHDGVGTIAPEAVDEGSSIRAERDMFILELDPATGDSLKVATFGEPPSFEVDDQWFLDLAASGDRLFAVGIMESDVVIGGNFHENSGLRDLVVAAFDLDLEPLWSVSFGALQDDGHDHLRIAVDDAGHVYVTGTTESDALRFFDQAAALTDPASDTYRATYLLKLDGTTGETIFARMFGGAFDDKMAGLSISGNTLFLGASATESMQWGDELPVLETPDQFPGCTLGGDCYDSFVAKLIIDDSL